MSCHRKYSAYSWAMKFLLVALAISSFAFAEGASARTSFLSCPGYDGEDQLSSDVDLYYSNRAASIVREAIAQNRQSLSGLVAPDAKFTVWNGKQSVPASTEGVEGAIKSLGDLGVVSFLSKVAKREHTAGEWRECSWQVTVDFRTADDTRGFLIGFAFRDGQLVQASVNETMLIEGRVLP